ncbi:MAG: hypothetical protein H6757_03480 [Candidatus Omnitrophica bacterium]|nr:hypothetical protein [Candidatus Omnitrophota bacterium]
MDTGINRFFAWAGSILDIRPGERTKTWVMFIYFFFIIATIWMLKPVRNSLFLDELGAENLRYVYMGEGVFLIGVVWLFVQFSKRVTRKQLYNGVLLLCILSLMLFRMLFKAKVPYLSALFYVWASSYSIIMTTQFFTFANDIFNPGEAKRLFGVILSGGSLGGVLGGILTRQLVGIVGTENLLYVIAGMILLCNVLVMMCWKHLVPAEEDQRAGKATEENTPSGKKLLMGSSYLLMILALIMFAKIASTVVDNQFNGMVEMSIHGKDARTSFYGGFFSFLNALSFCMQFFATGLVLRYLGVGIALWILPVGLLFGALGTTAVTALSASIFLKAFDGSTNYSIQQASREVLYLPVQPKTRYRVKPVIDMLGYRLAKSLGGVYIAVMAPLLGLSDVKLGLLVLFIIPVWFLVAWKLKGGYAGMLRQSVLDHLDHGNSAGAETSSQGSPLSVMQCLYHENALAQMEPFMEHHSTLQRKLASMAYLIYSRSGSNMDITRQQMTAFAPEASENTPSPWDRELEALENRLIENLLAPTETSPGSKAFFEDFAWLEEVLLSGPENLPAQKRVLSLFACYPQRQTAAKLLCILKSVNSNELRSQMIQTLVLIYTKSPEITVDRSEIRQALIRESLIYQTMAAMRSYYERKKSDPQTRSLGILLQALREEALERIFDLLGLIYPHEKMSILSSRIRQSKEGAARAHAVELLLHTIDKDMLKCIRPVLEERVNRSWNIKILESVKDCISFGDQWTLIAGLFFIFEFGMQQEFKDLDAILSHANLSFLKQS